MNKFFEENSIVAARNRSKDMRVSHREDIDIWEDTANPGKFLCTISSLLDADFPPGWKGNLAMKLKETARYLKRRGGSSQKSRRNITSIRDTIFLQPKGLDSLVMASYNLKLRKEQWLKIGQAQGWDKDKNIIIDLSKESGQVGSLIGGTAGTIVGQALIPIPIVGGLIGGVVGGFIGDWIGGSDLEAEAERGGAEAVTQVSNGIQQNPESLQKLNEKMTQTLSMVGTMIETTRKIAISINAPCASDGDGQCDGSIGDVASFDAKIQNLNQRISALSASQNNNKTAASLNSKNPQEVCSLLKEILGVRECIEQVIKQVNPAIEAMGGVGAVGAVGGAGVAGGLDLGQIG